MARPDLDALMSALLPFAQRMLSKHGEFYPFGAAIDRDGQVRLMAGGADTDRPLANQIIDALVTGFRQAAAEGEVRAVGLCFDARTIPPGAMRRSIRSCWNSSTWTATASSSHCRTTKACSAE